ncbi:MAG TPA: dockerin type I domain-containing protein [Candidatus Binatia bacterium]|jgi:hypothetical protein
MAGVVALLSPLLAGSPQTAAGAGSTTTTTTNPTPPPTTTLAVGTDVTGGGRFHGGFIATQFDLYTFDLAAPAVLVATTSDGKDFCNADTVMALQRNGTVLATDDDSGPGQCSKITYRLTDPDSYQIIVSGYQGLAAPDYYLDVEFVHPVCGNGIVELLEECDDGNMSDGDCCSSACTKNPDGSPCDDGLACDGTDTCSAGACTVHSLNPCPGANGDANCSESCSDADLDCNHPDPDGSACDDGIFCNGVDRCLQGSCSQHAGNPCHGPDGDGNCSESCNEFGKACNGHDPDGSVCDDTKFCNGSDHCLGGGCTVHSGNPCPGADGDGNCSESCNESAENCKGADPNGSKCDNGLFCDGSDTCSGGTCSVHSGSPCPGPDGDSNCAESCSEAAKNCSAKDADGSPCNDGVFCNGADTCLNGTCSVHAGSPCPGPDGDGNCAESCNEATASCNAADPNGSACNDGVFCNGADTCSGGTCSVHAGSPCPGPDGDGNCAESCNEAGKACNAADPNGSACNDGVFCNGNDTCSSGSCTVHSGNPCPGVNGDANCSQSCNESGKACNAADPNGSPCNDGLFCNGADTCQSGACSVHAGNPCPGPDGDGNCSESCDETSDSCTAADANGSPCNDGLFCNGTDTCQGGACTTHSGNPCPGPDGDANCSESCDETTDSCTAADSNGSPCNDGVFCNGSDTCSGGTCSVHSGNPCPGADGDGNCSESCSEAGAACNAPDPNGSACNDGVFCNGADTCSNGACSVHAGNPCPGPDGDGNCSESCNEAGAACNAPDPNGSACSDGLFCNGADTCSGGSCSVHAGNPCPGPDGDGNCAESCNESGKACNAADPDGSACDDSLACDGTDTCSGGHCSVHSGNPCPGPDGDSNCSESCSDAGVGCTGADPNGSPCDDGIFCNGADSCLNGACSVHAGSPCPGPDGDGNCAESCNELAKTCGAPDPNGSACNDGVFCNGADTCSGGACSIHAGNPCAGPDGDGNCSESCNEAAAACNAPDPNGSACTDGIFCNGNDTCSNGACSVHSGNPCPGPDGDADCSESCSEANKACNAHDPDGSACNDGLFCNGADTCSGGTCSQHAGNPCPGPDGDGNCAESCNEVANSCNAADADGAACDDGLFCNGDDTCTGGTCSHHSGNPCPGPDGDGNCAESCGEGAKACNAADPDGSACNDGVFCDGTDTCMAGTCSQHSGNPCPGGNGDGNCSQSCNEVSDNCTAADPNGSACDDGNSCTAGDACNGAGACVGGTAVDCDDADPCTTDTCNQSGPLCTHTRISHCGPQTTTTTTLVETACGDVNGDATVSASDALAILKAAVGGSQCQAQPCVCDASGDGRITAADALVVLRFAVHQPVTLSCHC